MPPSPNHLLVVLPLVFLTASGKVYERCELARELVRRHEIPMSQAATWVCIARHESGFNTSATNPGSGDHGIFQISDLYWCSPHGFACGVACAALEDEDLEDDVVCARRIYREHKRLSGDGFNAWTVYGWFCKGEVGGYVQGCFDEVEEVGGVEGTSEAAVGVRISGSLVTNTTEKITTTSSTTIGTIKSEEPTSLITMTATTKSIEKSTSKTRMQKRLHFSGATTTTRTTTPTSQNSVSAPEDSRNLKYTFGKVNYTFRWKNNGFSLVQILKRR